MACPHADAFYLPLLKAVARPTISRKDAPKLVAKDLALSPEDMRERTRKGNQSKYVDRTLWAANHMEKAGLLAYPVPGQLEATEVGRKFLREHPGGFGKADLLKVPKYARWAKWAKNRKPDPDAPDTAGSEEIIREEVAELRGQIAPGLLERIARRSPDFLGNLAIDILLRAEHGSSLQGSALAFTKIGRHTRECVIDLQGPFRKERVQLRAARTGTAKQLGDRDIRDFVEDVEANSAPRGLFVTTSEFTPKARTSAARAASRIDLVGGSKLTALMMELNVGCRGRNRYAIPEIDEDYFLRV